VIRRALKRGIDVARTAAKVAQGLIVGPGGPGFEVGEYEDFEAMRKEAAAQDLAEGIHTDDDEHDAIDAGTVELSAEDLRILLEVELSEDHPQLVDVRSRPAWKAAHIPHAVSHPLGGLEDSLESLDPQRAVVLYGESDTQSVDGSYVLKRAGFTKVESLAGGIDAWVGAGNEVEAG
jgi:rhodanese-related sulfurtransferase